MKFIEFDMTYPDPLDIIPSCVVNMSSDITTYSELDQSKSNDCQLSSDVTHFVAVSLSTLYWYRGRRGTKAVQNN